MGGGQHRGVLDDGGVQVGRKKRFANDVAHVAGGLTSTITNLHGAENWSSTQVDCLDIGDMMDPDPAALDATVLKIGVGKKE